MFVFIAVLFATVPVNAQTAEDYLKKGIDHYENDLNWTQAMSDFNKAIELDPRSAKAYMYRGAVQNDNAQALADFNKAIGIDPNYSEAYYHRGIFYYRKMGDFTKAMSDFDKEIELNPDHANSYYYRGTLYEKKDNGILETLHKWMGQADTSNETKALSDYNKAIEVNPADRQAYLERAMCYSSLKEFDKAWADIHKVEQSGINIDPWYIDTLKKASGRDN